MLKHRGFPGRLTGTDHQFTIRRANVKEGRDKDHPRERFKDRKPMSTAWPTRSSWPRSGSISAKSRSNAATWMPGGCPGCSGARSCPPKTRSIPVPMRRCCAST
jgi:hypothetical protein